eukprot:SAG25_NODE_12083_length_288_cov_0.825397_1_plen_81_part_10
MIQVSPAGAGTERMLVRIERTNSGNILYNIVLLLYTNCSISHCHRCAVGRHVWLHISGLIGEGEVAAHTLHLLLALLRGPP